MQTNRFLVIHHFHLLLFHVRLGDEVKHLNSILEVVLYNIEFVQLMILYQMPTSSENNLVSDMTLYQLVKIFTHFFTKSLLQAQHKLLILFFSYASTCS